MSLIRITAMDISAFVFKHTSSLPVITEKLSYERIMAVMRQYEKSSHAFRSLCRVTSLEDQARLYSD